jgi:hypothetical protein
MAGIDYSEIHRNTRFICDSLAGRQTSGFQDPVIFAKIDALVVEGKKSLCVRFSFDTISGLRELCEELERRSFEKVPIPDEFLEMITVFNQEAMECLRESQARFDLWERDHTMTQMLLFLWMAFFMNVRSELKKVHESFELFAIQQYFNDYSRDVRQEDIRVKVCVIHEMLLSSWRHPFPPRTEDIIFPRSKLQNEMLMEKGYPDWGTEPEYGFFELPTLKPDAAPLSIPDYCASECTGIDEDVVCDNRTVTNFVKHAKEPDFYDYNPFENDPTFLQDLMERYGSTKYSQICRIFPGDLWDL